MRLLSIIILCVISIQWGLSQIDPCNITMSGKVTDQHDAEPLEFANIFIQELGIGTVVDREGKFRIDSLCPGQYHMDISHIGCETQRLYLNLQNDTSLFLELEHHSEYIDEVTIQGGRSNQSIGENRSRLTKSDISNAVGKSLAEITKNIAGVSSLKNGTSISKPIIHGLLGNRVIVLNNGIAQAGQQWGNDHAPEIDPNVAQEISIIKGASALLYGGQSIGGVVEISPGQIDDDPHIHGHALYGYETNGRGHNLAASIEQAAPWAKWRMVTSLKKSGDQHTPDYFLTNSGRSEQSAALQIMKSLSESWNIDLYYSIYNTNLGILRGSHIGNLSDLESAITRDVPFFTNEGFSYQIEAPSQKVQHHLLKLESKYFIDDNHFWILTYGGQINNRKEYDVRRGGRSDIPALSLNMLTHNLDGRYQIEKNHYNLSMGLQSQYMNNHNVPETNILPLIPNYRSLQLSPYIIWKGTWDQTQMEGGIRFDQRRLEVTRITTTLPREIEQITHNFSNIAIAIGGSQRIGETLQSKMNINWAQRAPEVNELYSAGLHQGVSGIEEGNEQLNSERSLKVVWTNFLNINDKLYVELTSYYQWINDYIFLQPLLEPRLTIRGAFPVYQYQQTNATIGGLDALIKSEITNQLSSTLKYSIVRGRDQSQKTPLVLMPADQISSQWNYSLHNMKYMKNSIFSIEGLYQWRQSRLESFQDFLAPPDGYFLMNTSFSTDISIRKKSIYISLQVDNLFDLSYRDYLNRLRYYADETGRSFRLIGKYKF